MILIEPGVIAFLYAVFFLGFNVAKARPCKPFQMKSHSYLGKAASFTKGQWKMFPINTSNTPIRTFLVVLKC